MSQIEARRICLGETVRLSAEHGATRIVFERDDAAVEADKKVLYPLLHNSQVRYDFREKRSEPLLWIADAIVWCYTAGSPWRRLAAPLIDEVRAL